MTSSSRHVGIRIIIRIIEYPVNGYPDSKLSVLDIPSCNHQYVIRSDRRHIYRLWVAIFSTRRLPPSAASTEDNPVNAAVCIERYQSKGFVVFSGVDPCCPREIGLSLYIFSTTSLALFAHVGKFFFCENAHVCNNCAGKLAATLRGSRPGVQSASLIMTSLMTS